MNCQSFRLLKFWSTWLKSSANTICSFPGVWSSVIWLLTICSSLFAVSTDTSVRLVFSQKVSSIGCTPNIASTVRGGDDVAWLVSEKWAPRLAPPLGAVVSSFVVLFSTCAPALPPVVLSLSSGFGSPPFLYLFFHWLPDLLLRYCVYRYQAAASISAGYAV